MTEQSDRPEPEQGPIGQLVRLFLTQLLAVVAIAAVITAVVSWTGAGLDDDVTAAPADVTESASPRPDSSSAPATTSSAPATPAPSSTSAAPTKSSPESTLPLVDVLNQSAPGGSASQLADQLRQRGWRIGRVDDFRGNVSTTTVYWLTPDMRRDARRVSRDLGGVRVQQGFSTLVEGRISVILVD